MTVLWISLVAVLFFTYTGYRRGVLRIVALFGALLLAGLAAVPLAGLFLPLVARAGFIPRTLLPLAAPLTAGLVVFILLSCLASWLLKRRELVREAQDLPRLEPWEKLGGAILGALWGGALVTLVLTGLHLLGRVEQELARDRNPQPAPVEKPAAPAPPEPSLAPETAYQTINRQIDASPLAAVVQRVNPAEERIARVFGDLATVTGDPVLFDRFRNHPSIARLTGLPQLTALARDAEIQQLLERRQYFALLDHPRLAASLQDKALVAECRKVDLEGVLAEVRRRPR